MLGSRSAAELGFQGALMERAAGDRKVSDGETVGPRPGGPRSWAKTLGLFLKTVKKESGPEGQGLKGKLLRL